MAEHPSSRGHADKSLFEQENYQDYAAAMRIVASARRIFLLLLVVSLVIHGGTYAAAKWWPALWTLGATTDEGDDAPADTALTDEAEMAGADATPDAGGDTPAGGSAGWHPGPVTAGVLQISASVGVLCCLLLIFSYLLAMNIALSGRLGGVQGCLAALFWMAVVLVLLLPWQNWLGPVGCPVNGVYITADDVADTAQTFTTRAHEIRHYARYLGYPVLTLLIVLVADRRYARGHRLAQRQVEAWLHVKRL